MVGSSLRDVQLDRQLAIAGVGQALLLVLLLAAGLGPVGCVVGALHLLFLPVLVGRSARRSGAAALGPADVVTLTRAVLTGGCAALVADGLAFGASSLAPLVGLAAVALVLDAVDGRVARSTGTVSTFGARFDMEVDAYLLLVLSAHAATVVGGWVLAIGLMRYLFVAAGWPLPWLRGTLPSRFSAKLVTAVQGVVLVVVAARVLPPPWPTWCAAVALGALIWSFATSVQWLWRYRD